MPTESLGDTAGIAWVFDLVETINGCDARFTAIRGIVAP